MAHESVLDQLLIRDIAMADRQSPHLLLRQSILIEAGHIVWVHPSDDTDPGDAEVLDGGGATAIPALVDSHSYLTGQVAATGSSGSPIHPNASPRLPATTGDVWCRPASCGLETSARRPG